MKVKINKTQRKLIGIILLFFLVLILLIFTKITSVSTLFLAYIFFIFYWNIKATFSILLALLCLLIMLLLISIDVLGIFSISKFWKESFANYLYFFLLISFIKQSFHILTSIIVQRKSKNIIKKETISTKKFERNVFDNKSKKVHDITFKK